MAGSVVQTPEGGFGFPRSARLRKGKDILAVLTSGASTGLRGMKLSWLPGSGDGPRMAVALRRGYGNAVQRNRAKRLVREAWRLQRRRIRGAWDFVVQVFPARDEWAERSGQLKRLIDRSGLAGGGA